MSVIRQMRERARTVASYAPAVLIVVIAIISSAGQRWH